MASITQNLIEKVTISGEGTASIASTAYGICNTAANDPDKIVEMTGFVLYTGVTIHVKFENANTAPSPRLFVNSVPGDQNNNGRGINLYNDVGVGTQSMTTSWPAGAVVSFTFDGTYWQMNFGVNTDTTYNVVQQYYPNDSTNPISGAGVARAIETLDAGPFTGSASQTVNSITETDGEIDVSFQPIRIEENQVNGLPQDLAAKASLSGAEFTGTVTLPSAAPTSENQAVTKKYVDDKTAGLTGAMHYIYQPNARFTVTFPAPTQQDPDPETVVTQTGTFSQGYTPAAGDVIIYEHQEFIYTGTKWALLGDEGSYALKTSTTVVAGAGTSVTYTAPTLSSASKDVVTSVTFDAGTTPTLDPTPITVKSVATDSTPTTASVNNGILTITIGSASTSENKVIPKVTSVGTAPTFTYTHEIITANTQINNAGSVALNISPETVVKP